LQKINYCKMGLNEFSWRGLLRATVEGVSVQRGKFGSAVTIVSASSVMPCMCALFDCDWIICSMRVKETFEYKKQASAEHLNLLQSLWLL